MPYYLTLKPKYAYKGIDTFRTFPGQEFNILKKLHKIENIILNYGTQAKC